MKETWKDEYCKKFGLCENQPKYSKCTCSKELKFISKEIESAIKAERERIVKLIKDLPDYTMLPSDKDIVINLINK